MVFNLVSNWTLQKQLIENRQKQKRKQSGIPHISDARENRDILNRASTNSASSVRRPAKSPGSSVSSPTSGDSEIGMRPIE